MTPKTGISSVLVFIASMALPAWGQQYFLYTPQPVVSGQKRPAQDSVLVREIEIQKGDTLYGLSRKYSGKGMYYPQILLFNSIKNPNLIYQGKTLKVPVSQSDTSSDGNSSAAAPKAKTTSIEKKTPTNRQPAAPASQPNTELSLSDLKSSAAAKGGANRHSRKKGSTHARKATVREVPAPAASLESAPHAATGQKLFEAAVKAYRNDDCKTALELLDRYLADNSGSPLAADASLYKAECYLKMSAQ